MRERYRYLIWSGLDLSASLFTQFTLLGATVIIVYFDSLRNVAFFTFALSICGPVSLFAGMSLSELIFSGDPRYRNLWEVGLAQLLCYTGLAVVAGMAVTVWDSSYSVVFAIVAAARGIDMICALAVHVMRARSWFQKIALLGFLQLSLFGLLALLFLSAQAASPVIAVAAAMALTSFFQASISLYWLRGDLLQNSEKFLLRPFDFIRRHLFRSVAVGLNSVQSNVPRYALEFLISPQHQAAYSLVFMASRAGTTLFQSLFVPIIGQFKVRYAAGPVRAAMTAIGLFCLATLVFSAVSISVWLVAVHVGIDAALKAELRPILTPAAGVIILVSSSIYLLRFAIWQIVSLLEDGQQQTRMALAGVVSTSVLSIVLVPGMGVSGAAFADSIGNLLLIFFPVVLFYKRKLV